MSPSTSGQSSKGRRSHDIQLQPLDLNHLHPTDSRISTATDRPSSSSSSHFRIAPTISLTQEGSVLSYPFYQRDSRSNSPEGRTSGQTVRRPSLLRGIDDASSYNNSVLSLFDEIATENPSAIQLGLDDALGKDGNWLAKSTDTAGPLPDINRDHLNLDFERPVSELLRPIETANTNDEVRSAEEGLPHVHSPHPTSVFPRSPVLSFSRAVKALSARILAGQLTGDTPSRDATKSPNRQIPGSPNMQLTSSPNRRLASSPRPLSPNRPISPNFLNPFSPPSPSRRLDRHDTLHAETTESSFEGTTIKHLDPIIPITDIPNTFYGGPHVSSPNPFLESSTNNTTLVDPEPEEGPLPIKLVGKSLKIFGTENKLRIFLYQVLHSVWVEPFVFFLIIAQTVLLTIGSAKNIFEGQGGPRNGNSLEFQFPSWSSSYINWCILVLFICYSIIVVSKIIAYGLWDDSQRKKLMELANKLEDVAENDRINPPTIPNGLRHRGHRKNLPVVRSFANLVPAQYLKKDQPAGTFNPSVGFRVAPERAYLRSSWARLDFIAIVCYWISLFMLINAADTRLEAFIFRLLSALPILHLLNLTRGTSSILKSLKVAAPLLVNVGIFLGFFW